MRTKALLCAVALAAGIGSTMAQVYSLNVVGYYNVTVPANQYQLIANQLNTTNNTLGALLPSPAPGTLFYKYVTGTGYSIYTFDEFDLVWYPDGLVSLNPGEGGLIKNPTGSPMTLTFVGEVMQGSLTNAIPNGYSIRSSMVPQAGDVTTLGLPPTAGDLLYKYIPGTGYSIYTFDEFDLVWYPSVPTMNVGESFLISKQGAANWVRNFTVQ